MSAILLHCTNQISNTQSQCLVKAALLCPVSDSHGLLNHPRGIMCHVVYCYYCMHPIYPRIKSNGVMQICWHDITSLNTDFIIGKALKALNVLLHNCKRYPMKPNVLCQLFDAFVGCILSYSSEVWGYTKSKEIERVHLKFCKRIDIQWHRCSTFTVSLNEQ